jgi:hypothetical protein
VSGLENFARLVDGDHGLCVVLTLRPDGTIASSEIFTAAGGTHDDWPTYDRVMAEERRVAVLVAPERVSGIARS